jgi:hypothetical protein
MNSIAVSTLWTLTRTLTYCPALHTVVLRCRSSRAHVQKADMSAHETWTQAKSADKSATSVSARQSTTYTVRNVNSKLNIDGHTTSEQPGSCVQSMVDTCVSTSRSAAGQCATSMADIGTPSDADGIRNMSGGEHSSGHGATAQISSHGAEGPNCAASGALLARMKEEMSEVAISTRTSSTAGTTALAPEVPASAPPVTSANAGHGASSAWLKSGKGHKGDSNVAGFQTYCAGANARDMTLSRVNELKGGCAQTLRTPAVDGEGARCDPIVAKAIALDLPDGACLDLNNEGRQPLAAVSLTLEVTRDACLHLTTACM